MLCVCAPLNIEELQTTAPTLWLPTGHPWPSWGVLGKAGAGVMWLPCGHTELLKGGKCSQGVAAFLLHTGSLCLLDLWCVRASWVAWLGFPAQHQLMSGAAFVPALPHVLLLLACTLFFLLFSFILFSKIYVLFFSFLFLFVNQNLYIVFFFSFVNLNLCIFSTNKQTVHICPFFLLTNKTMYWLSFLVNENWCPGISLSSLTNPN